MLPRNHPDRIQITFDDRRLVANAGLLLPATLARHLGLPELVRQRLDLGDAPGRANTSDKMMTLVASALAGGDCIDDADVLRTGGTACTLGGTVKAPSTLGTFLRSFRWGHVRQLDRVSRELLARAWQAGAGPGDGPLTNNEELKRAWEAADESLMSGHRMAEVFGDHKIIPSLFRELVSIGEESNTLPKTMTELADSYQKEFQSKISGILAVVEPVSQISVGGVVLMMMLSIIKPILGAADKLGG